MESDSNKVLDEVTQSEYKYGFVTDIETEFAPVGLTEDTIRYISEKKNEPEFMLEFRLKAYRHWLTMKQPRWAHLKIEPIDFQSIIFYAAPKKRTEVSSLDEVDPELLATFNKLGISLEEQKKLAGELPEDYEGAILTGFVDTLSQEIGRALQYFFTSTPHHKVHYVMLAGGTASLPGLKDRVTELTGFASMVVNPFENMKLGPGVREGKLRREAPAYLTACGLAMRRFIA